MISAQQLRFAYPGGDCALNVDDFSVQAGEVVGIAGSSGAGKTTFLRLLAGLLPSREGSVTLNQKPHSSLPEAARRKTRLQHCGLIFQDFELLDYLTVEDNVLLPMRLGKTLGKTQRQRAQELVSALDLGHHWQSLTCELSQGERQRVAVARALAHEPQIVLADEPTSSLDEKRKQLVMNLLVDYTKTRGAALVVVSHDAEIFRRVDRVVNVEDWKA